MPKRTLLDRATDLQVDLTLALNPLLWRIRYQRHEWFWRLEVGPLEVTVIW